MNQEPCPVCGEKDLNLIDGYYYCVECGTQDKNARETVIDHSELADGTLGYVVAKKINTTIKDDNIEMSTEWIKWHTFNFILSGLADELIALGAAPGFKTKLLWVWTKFMKEFYVKEDVLSKSLLHELYQDESKSKQGDINKSHIHIKNPAINKFDSTMTFQLLMSLIYVALNLERSDISLSHLQRFLVDGHLSSTNCMKYVPEDLKAHSLPKWSDFIKQCSTYQQDFDSVNSTLRFRMTAMSAFKLLNLGTPLLPDLKKIVNNCITELCLPGDFKNLVFSLLDLAPLDSMTLKECDGKGISRIPDYEGMVMAYTLVALKMCFGMDDHYEIQLSNEIDKINSEEEHPKSYKLGKYSNLTDRLFCFKEWYIFLQFRKIILSKYYLPIAEKTDIEVDGHLFMEQTKERITKRKTLFEEITMEIIDRLPLDDEYPVIPKSEFIPTFTPMATYTKVVLQFIQDPDLKLLLSEDFTQYSLKYACLHLKLPTKDQDVFQGVTKDNFSVDTNFYDKFRGSILDDPTMVFVKTCENKNWLETKPPEKKYVFQIEHDNDRVSNLDHDLNEEINETSKHNTTKTHKNHITTEISNGYSEAVSLLSELFDETEAKYKLELMCEEDEDRLIFDDDFADMDIDCKKIIPDNANGYQSDNEYSKNDSQLDNEFLNSDICDNHVESSEYIGNSLSDTDQMNDSQTEQIYDPSTFDREQTVKELVLAACKEYGIPIPLNYKPKVAQKRSTGQTNDEPQDKDAKRRRAADKSGSQIRTKPGEARIEIDRITTAYYTYLDKQLIMTDSGTFQDVVERNLDETLNSVDDQPNLNVDRSIDSLATADTITMNDEAVNSGLDDAPDSLCLEETFDDKLDGFLRKGDPKYDGKTHDTKQLYLKFRDTFNIDDVVKLDGEMEKIINRQLEGWEKMVNNDDSEENIADLTEKHVEDCSLKTSEIALGELNEPISQLLLSRDINVQCFNYWMRTYPAKQAFKSVGINTQFDGDLLENFPKSFSFMISECATIVNSTPYQLYKHVQTVEERLAAVKKRPP